MDAVSAEKKRRLGKSKRDPKHTAEAPKEAPNWHTLTIEEVASQLQASLEGLSQAEAQKRLDEEGPNVLGGEGGIQVHKILIRHTFNFIISILVVAAVLSFAVGAYIDGGVIILLIILNILIGALQEFRSEKTLQKLKELAAATSKVIRDGNTVEVPSSNLVRGDVVVLQEGAKVPADLRIFESVNMECDEAILTGESVPIEKMPDTLDDPSVPLGERVNMAFMNTIVTRGKGKGLVVAQAKDSEVGKIAQQVTQPKSEKTDLQRRMDKLGAILIVVATVSLGLVIFGGWIWGTYIVWPDGVRLGVSVAVAIIPAALVPVMTLTITVGVRRMAARNAIVRKLAALEALGNVTNICSDKTGTLTQGRMTASAVWTYGHTFKVTGSGAVPEGDIEEDGKKDTDCRSLNMLLSICSLCNSAALYRDEEKGWVSSGSPTEVALLVLAEKRSVNWDKLQNEWERAAEFPFDSSVKMMSTVYKRKGAGAGTHTLFAKGAPEIIVPLCNSILTDDGVQRMNGQFNERVNTQQLEMSKHGLRVLCVAYRDLEVDFSNSTQRHEVEKNMTLVGLIGIEDPPRPDVPPAIQKCHNAGITVHMLTGDNAVTARAIAKQVGIVTEDTGSAEFESSVLDKYNDEQLKAMKEVPLVIARCSPASKVQIVKALHYKHKVVGMTGDGVNDAPAIKQADIGIAMGSGSDVTKEAADIVLSDDDFSTIVVAVEEGRRIFANIRKFAVHLLAANAAETLVILVTVLAGLYSPLNALQILWLNLITSSPPAFALGTEPASKHIMDKNYRPPTEPLFMKETMLDIFVYGILATGITVTQFVVIVPLFPLLIDRQSITFLSFTLIILLLAYVCRNTRRPFYENHFLSRYWLHGTMLLGLGSISLTLYIPVLRERVFEQGYVDGVGWGIALASCLVFFVLAELYKLIKRRIRRKLMRKRKTKEEELKKVTVK